MKASRWAKIFSPFDALEGFDERIAEKEVLYKVKQELCDDELTELNQKLDFLHNLTWNSRMAKVNRVTANVTYFVPCADTNHSAFGIGGSYETVSGIVLRAGQDTLTLLTEGWEQRILFSDIKEITGTVFDCNWEPESV